VLYTIAPSITPHLTGTVTKVYDTTTAATLTGSNYGSPTGAVDGDTVTLSQPSSGSYATPDVGGPNINVSVSGITQTSATNGSVAVYGYGSRALQTGTSVP